jgi:hypothetical protein
MDICNILRTRVILWPFGTFCVNLVHFSGFGIMDQEKSGNPECISSGFPHPKKIQLCLFSWWTFRCESFQHQIFCFLNFISFSCPEKDSPGEIFQRLFSLMEFTVPPPTHRQLYFEIWDRLSRGPVFLRGLFFERIRIKADLFSNCSQPDLKVWNFLATRAKLEN